MSEINNSSLISVIVPVYNAMPYLKQCINSIINQTYTNTEIILVDDGSTDSSPRICDEYAQIDSRIVVIHKENGGLSSARNAGLDIAKGEYIGFVDSDDFISKQMYQKMIDCFDEEVDVISCGYFYCNEKGTVTGKNTITQRKIICEGNSLINTINRYGIIFPSKLFRKEILCDLRFRPGIKAEDADLMPEVLDRVKKAVFLKDSFYYYRMHQNSITHGEYTKGDYTLLRSNYRLYRYSVSKGKINKRNAEHRFGVAYSTICKKIAHSKVEVILDNYSELKRIQAIIRKNYKSFGKEEPGEIERVKNMRMMAFSIPLWVTYCKIIYSFGSRRTKQK